MRLARKTPIADGGAERNRFPVVTEFPVRGADRHNDLITAAAYTFVDRGAILDGDIDNTLFQLIGDHLDKSMLYSLH